MHRLTHHDFGMVNEFVLDLYSQPDLPSFRKKVVLSLHRFLSPESISYNEMDIEKGEMGGFTYPEIPKLYDALPILVKHMPEHPGFIHHTTSGSLAPTKIGDFLSAREFRKTAIYNEFYRYFGTRYQFTLFLKKTGEMDIVFALNRWAKDFGERERSFLSLLQPHLSQAYLNLSALCTLRQAMEFQREALNGGKYRLILLAPSGAVLWMSSRVEELLQKYFDAPGLSAQRIPDQLRRWLVAEQARMNSSNAALKPFAPLEMHRGADRLLIRVQAKEHGRLLLTLEEISTNTTCGVLRSFGLTAREAEVLHWASESKTNSEIATILGSRKRTVDKHMEHILAKLGVETRQAAILKTLQV